MKIFRYNSYHKIIAAALVLAWVAYRFSGSTETAYYGNGQIKCVGEQKLSRNHGVWIWYYSDSKMKMKGRFESGKRDGIWETWAPNGVQTSEVTYSDDVLNGKCTYWDSDGNKLREEYHSKEKK